jgi:hypothetical protein
MIPCDGGKTSVYNAHFFNRYNERLNLGLKKQADIIVHFLKYNHDVYDVLLPEKNQINVIGYCRDGMLMGQLFENRKWLVWKTFINRDIAREQQLNLEDRLLAQIHRQAQQNLGGPVVVMEEMHQMLCKVVAVKAGVKH